MSNNDNENAKSIGAVIALFIGLAVLKTAMDGGCEASDRKQLQQMDSENKQWQKEQDQKAGDADREQARRNWDNIPHGR